MTTAGAGGPRDRDLVVLVVEDEPVAAAAHRGHVDAVPGFRALPPAATAAEALMRLRGAEGAAVDLVLLDMHLPDRSGLDVVRALRAAGRWTDVLAVTSARELSTVRAATSLGVVGYLLKPFAGAALRERLRQYAAARGPADADGAALSQAEVDRLLSGHLVPGEEPPARGGGLSEETLAAVVAVLREASSSAAEVATRVGVGRVTARRYLEHLVGTGAADRRPRYGGAGRPELEYRWTAS
ncbi:response regulator [Pseudokineococcus marinus]|uniref:Transcriptional regulatory protein n=1 Tax=Pseudokineococcus marinus TaxID=351215 RepID=A0A849BNF8_9ACTN|nr:response regulator [Pseudokineococcus marinus]NNH22342.1 response regulator [Pseudokineococcus marinus]